MLYYAAPMEGITTYIYRNAHARWYGGIDKYFTPFIAGKKMTGREIRDILPENNIGIPLVPQILTNKSGDFLCIAERISSYGYGTVNLNLGCPSGTVTAKKRGAGFLGDPDALDAFLYEIYEKCPLKISIKTRLGVSDLDEWNRLLEIYARYPVQELIIHTRLLREFYTGRTHPEAYAEAAARLCPAGIPLCYNGDITSPQSLQAVLKTINSTKKDTAEAACPYHNSGIGRVMVGRGLLQNPALTEKLRQSRENDTENTARSCRKCSPGTLRAFHDEILDGYKQIMSGDSPVLFKMKDLWTYMVMGFVDTGGSGSARSDSIPFGMKDAQKYLKKIRKAERLSAYLAAVDSLFRECEEPA